MRSVRTCLCAVGWLTGITFLGCASSSAHAQAYLEYGNENVLGTGSYSSDPKSGASLTGLSANTVTDATNYVGHGYPFSPAPGDYPGTDQIYVGSIQTGAYDGYAGYPGRIAGPQVITLDYSSLLPAVQKAQTLTLGIDADDFQNPVFGNPFTASINGTVDTALTAHLNSLNETGPQSHFFTIGIDPSLLTANDILTLSIDEGGNGGDGWAIDFLTVGVTGAPTSVPEPGSMALILAAGTVGAAFLKRRRK